MVQNSNVVAIEEGWANNGAIKLHFLRSSGRTPGLTPIVFIAGVFGSAESYRTEIEFLAPRQCLAISLRGQGKSDAPRSGYGLADFAADIHSVVSYLGLSGFVVMAYSRGVPCAIRYSSEHPQELRGLIVGDYPARLTRPTWEWAERVRRTLPAESIPSHVITSLIHEAQDIELWCELEWLDLPVLVLRGMQQWALLSDQDVSLYLAHLPRAEVIEMHDSGHELWKPDYDAFMRIIEAFLREVDGTRDWSAG
jgi:pimeloyl-ACP methyl ester carboxylesterase